MEFRLLGPVEFWATEKLQTFGSAKERHLLAVLLLACGRPVPADTLVDRVWGETPPPEVRQNLQTDIYRIRRVLKTAGVSDKARITAGQGTYTLEVDPECVDLFRSRSLYEQAVSIRRSGNVQATVKLLREALDLWRSEPLTGLAGEWFDQMRVSLDGDYRALARELVEVELAAGSHAEIIGFLVDLTGRYPLDETFVGQLMIAYYRCGRQADAIKLYTETRWSLNDGTGTDPSPRLQSIYMSILRHDPSVGAPQRSSADGTPGLSRLPAPLPEFTGRTIELAELSDATRALHQVVILEGMPGVGKSTLAIKLAHEVVDRVPDLCIHLHLYGHDPQRLPETPGAALSKLLREVGVAPSRIPRELADRIQLWREVMEGRRALIVLDDAADSAQVRPLLPRNPDCRVIVTSRRHLAGIEGARHHRLAVLPDGDAAVLFARLAGPDAEVSPDTVAKAVQLCGGLPLAIGLAATRLRDRQVSSIEALVEELHSPHEDIADLQSPGLAAAFELSYRDLSPTQRRVFRRLGLSPASELTATAVAILGDISASEAEKSIETFAENHLLEEISPGRFQLHDLVRQYALARAIKEESAPNRRRTISRMLDFFLKKADLADRKLYPHHTRADTTPVCQNPKVGAFKDEAMAKGWLADESRNLFHLVQYAANHEWHTHVIDLARTVARYFDSTSQWEEAEEIQQRALQVALSLGLPRVIAQVRVDLSVVQWRVGQIREALANATEARDIARREQYTAIEAAALDQIGLVVWTSSNYREALAYFGEALDIYHDIGDRHREAECLGHIGMVLVQTGRHQEALRSFNEALAIDQEIGDVRGEATTLSNLANTHLELGYHRDAYQLFKKSDDIYRTLTGRRNRAILKNNLADVERYRGRLDSALKNFRAALAEFVATGDRINESITLNYIGFTLSSMEKYNEALIHHRTAMSIADDIDNAGEKIRARLGIADTDVGMGRFLAASENYEEARQLARTISDPRLEAQALAGIAHVTGLTEGQGAARIYWRQAYDIFQQIGIVPEIEAVRIRLEIINLSDS